LAKVFAWQGQGAVGDGSTDTNGVFVTLDATGDVVLPDFRQEASGIMLIDCNTNGTQDACDIMARLFLQETPDCNTNDIPDECESADCNTNGTFDPCETGMNANSDCNTNGTPDVCESE